MGSEEEGESEKAESRLAPSSTTCQSLAIAPSLKTLESEEEVREAEAKVWEHVVFRGRQTEVVGASSAK